MLKAPFVETRSIFPSEPAMIICSWGIEQMSDNMRDALRCFHYRSNLATCVAIQQWQIDHIQPGIAVPYIPPVIELVMHCIWKAISNPQQQMQRTLRTAGDGQRYKPALLKALAVATPTVKIAN